MDIVGLSKISNGTIFDDLQLPLTHISILCHYLTLNVSEINTKKPQKFYHC